MPGPQIRPPLLRGPRARVPPRDSIPGQAAELLGGTTVHWQQQRHSFQHHIASSFTIVFLFWTQDDAPPPSASLPPNDAGGSCGWREQHRSPPANSPFNRAPVRSMQPCGSGGGRFCQFNLPAGLPWNFAASGFGITRPPTSAGRFPRCYQKWGPQVREANGALALSIYFCQTSLHMRGPGSYLSLSLCAWTCQWFIMTTDETNANTAIVHRGSIPRSTCTPARSCSTFGPTAAV